MQSSLSHYTVGSTLQEGPWVGNTLVDLTAAVSHQEHKAE